MIRYARIEKPIEAIISKVFRGALL